MTQTIAEAVRLAQQQLAAGDSARLDAELLLAHCLGVDRATIYREPKRLVPRSQQQNFSQLVDERRNGVPIAYLTGRAEFYSMSLRVNEHVLVPRPESELIIDIARDSHAEDKGVISPRVIVDLGTGSGALALALAQSFNQSWVIGVDRSMVALGIAKENAHRLGIDNISWLKSHWLTSFSFESCVEFAPGLIVSNPPYVETHELGRRKFEIGHEPELALDGGDDGMDAYRQIVPCAATILRPGGMLIVEHGYQQASGVSELFKQANFHPVKTYRDLSGHDRATAGVRHT